VRARRATIASAAGSRSEKSLRQQRNNVGAIFAISSRRSRGKTMLTQSALAVVDNVLEKAKNVGASSRAAICMQAACIRALVDEVESYPPSTVAVVSLQEQLADEVNRLLELVQTH
jgi:hypothetical protein